MVGFHSNFEWSVICNKVVTQYFNKINKEPYASIDAEAGVYPVSKKNEKIHVT
jgi:hypothetical protein